MGSPGDDRELTVAALRRVLLDSEFADAVHDTDRALRNEGVVAVESSRAVRRYLQSLLFRLEQRRLLPVIGRELFDSTPRDPSSPTEFIIELVEDPEFTMAQDADSEARSFGDLSAEEVGQLEDAIGIVRALIPEGEDGARA